MSFSPTFRASSMYMQDRCVERHPWLQLHALDSEPQEQHAPLHGNQWEWVAARIVHLRDAKVVFGHASLSIGSMKEESDRYRRNCATYLRGAGVQPRRSPPKLHRPRGHPRFRLVGRGVGLISERIEVISAFSTIRCSGSHGVVRVVERTTVVIKSYRCSPVWYDSNIRRPIFTRDRGRCQR